MTTIWEITQALGELIMFDLLFYLPPKFSFFAQDEFSNWPVEEDQTVVHPSQDSSPTLYLPSASFLLLPFSSCTSPSIPSLPRLYAPRCRWQHRDNGMISLVGSWSLSACCTITDWCSSSLAHCEVCVWERKEHKEQKRQGRGTEGKKKKKKLYCSAETEGRGSEGRLSRTDTVFSLQRRVCVNSGGHVCM